MGKRNSILKGQQMKERESGETIKARRPTADLIPLATIASQLLEDLEHIYGEPAKIIADKAEMEKLCIPQAGKLIVVATRNKQLREELLLCLICRVAIANKESVAIYSVNNSFIRFSQKLICAMADIPPDTAIYDGSMIKAEFSRLVTALEKLESTDVRMYSAQMSLLDWLRFAAHKMNQIFSGHAGMILVDGAQCSIGGQHHYIDMQQSLRRLKGVAEMLRTPIIVLYQLDPAIENHSSTLTRNELVEIEKLSKLTDGFVLMSGAREELVFAPPKIPNAKPVEWLDQITAFPWQK